MCAGCDPRELLAQSGLKATAQRVRVLGAVLAFREALSPQALLAAIRWEGPMDKVTLYRTLESLAEHGLISRHEAGDGSVRYCAAGPGHPQHHHFFCQRCRRLLCLDPDAVRVGADVPGVEQVVVRLDGTCADCRS